MKNVGIRMGVLFFAILPVFDFAAAPQQIDADSADKQTPRRVTVGILLFDGVQIIDYTGPYEVFGQAGMKVWTASVDGRILTTGMGMRVTPAYKLAEAPPADILVLPGGNVPHVVPETDPRMAWIRERIESAKAVLSVCNGVFFLSSAGLLDGKRATTYALMLDHLKMAAPGVTVVDERIVDNGKIVTVGGLSAGIDGALYLVARFLGKGRAREVANNMEYDWDPEREFNRAKLADVYIHPLIEIFPPLVPRSTELYEGNENHWKLRYRIEWPSPVEEMRRQFLKLAKENGWKSDSEITDWVNTLWSFRDRNGDPWRAQVTLVQMQDQGAILMEISVERVAKSE